MEILAIAQKSDVGQPDRAAVRSEFGVDSECTLLGTGGLLHPGKGLDDIVSWFLCKVHDPSIHLLCSVVPGEDGETERSVRQRWEKLAGTTSSPRLHIHMGDYGEWDWMCSFYRAIDVMLINSVSDSWGRMVSEAVGFRVPTLVRRAHCATNHIFPDIALVNEFADLSLDEFESAVRKARENASFLCEYAHRFYGCSVVRDQLIDLLRTLTPSDRLGEFSRISQQPRSLDLLDRLMDH